MGPHGAHRILIVDDDRQTAALARVWFRDQPYEILEAPDGASGLLVAAEQDPDVILLDLGMPGLDGMSVARRLKEDPATRAIPVIVLTADRNVESKVEAFQAGADDYVTKPFQFEELQARIGSFLHKRGLLLGLEARVRDLASTNAQLEQLLVVDEKTGLYNFRAFQRRLREEWQRAERYAVPVSLVFLDLDHFKQVNDRLGHPAGDQVLREFATLVTGGARATDVASRYGGEEFAVILPHTDAPMARGVAERIRRAVQEFVFLEHSSPTRITVSAGVATSTRDIDSMEALVRAADRALYAAKDRGRNQVVDAGSLGAPDERGVAPRSPRG
jgi:diguanylate cyclase (GGDEF)-like protein